MNAITTNVITNVAGLMGIVRDLRFLSVLRHRLIIFEKSKINGKSRIFHRRRRNICVKFVFKIKIALL